MEEKESMTMKGLKPFEELTDQELVELTDDMVEVYVAKACMEQGILRPPKPEPPLYADVLEPDVMVYGVHAGYRTLFHCSTHEDAVRAISDLHLVSVENDYTAHVEYAQALDVTDWEVKSKRVYSRARYEQLKGVLEANGKKKAVYEEKHEAWHVGEKQAEEIRERLYDVINAAVARFEEDRQIMKTFAKYTELSNGDKRVALRFLLHVYSEVEVRRALEANPKEAALDFTPEWSIVPVSDNPEEEQDG